MTHPEKVFGLENFGNTCYCNSVLQALFNLDSFRNYLERLGTANPREQRLETHGGTPHPVEAYKKQRFDEKAFLFKNKKQEPEHLDLEHLSLSVNRSKNGHQGADAADNGTEHVVGQLESPVQLPNQPANYIELRKRNALLKGPIVNVDQNFNTDYNLPPSLVTCVKDLFECINENSSEIGVASPGKLVETLKTENELFKGSMHQDAQEFLNFLINRIMEEESKMTAPVGMKARDIFGGMLTNEMRCLSCETVTKRNEQFFDFSLETFPNTSVFHCMRVFCGNEILDGNNKFYCDTCGSREEALKRLKVQKAPETLILHLKRFKFNEELQQNTKLMHRVLYSKYLRLPVTTNDCATPEKLYKLNSVVVHLGGGPSMGHYVSLCRKKGGWLLYDDEMVDLVSDRFVYQFFGDKNTMATAYLLLYEAVSERERLESDSVISTYDLPFGFK